MSLNLQSEISLHSANFERGIHHAKESVADLAKTFVIGAIGVATVEQAFERTIERAEELVNSAKRLDMTVEQIQLLRQAAKDAGTEFEGIAAAINKIDIARAKALGGDKKTMVAFSALGVSRGDLMTKTATDLFTGNISNTVKGTNIEQIAAPLREILGRGGKDVVGVLRTNFEELEHEMKKFGAMMDATTAVQLKTFKDQIDLASNIITANLAPAIVGLIRGVLRLVGSFEQAFVFISTFVGSIKRMSTSKDVFSPGKALKIALQEAINAASGFDKNNLVDKFDEKSEEIKRSIESPKPDFSKTEQVAKQMSDKAQKQRGDSDALIKVGNFLGASKGVIGNAQMLLVQHAASTSSNTRKTADKAEQIHTQLLALMDKLRQSAATDPLYPSN